jgi:hypothetical protein
LGTGYLLQYLQVQLGEGKIGVHPAQAAADQSHGQFSGIEQRLDALARGQVTSQAYLLYVYRVKTMGAWFSHINLGCASGSAQDTKHQRY